MRIILVRHTQTEGNVKHLIYGHTDYPLTEHGKEQLIEVVKKMKGFAKGKLISSPLGRALVLAQALEKTYGLALTIDERLEEMNLGILEGYTATEAQEKHPEVMEAFYEGNPEWFVPGGESYIAFEQRLMMFFDQIVDEGEDVVIVAHGGVVRTGLEYLLEAEPGASWQMVINNGAIAEVIIDEKGGKLKNLSNLD